MATRPEVLSVPRLGALASGPKDAAETVVYLHGWGASTELWWNCLALLADGVRGVALDLPGTGATPLPPALRTMADMAAWVSETCRRLRLPPVTLVGHSLGGNLAAQVALDHPTLVRRLALVDAALEPAHFPVRARWPLSRRYGRLALRLTRAAAWPMAAVGRRVPHAHGGGYWLPYARRSRLFLETNTDPALQTQLRALCENPHRAERLATLDIPLLIVHGERDSVIPVARARALAAALPHARLAVFPTAHHCPMDTDPSGFARVLREFVTA